jgi:hypothetical protein
LFNFLSYKSESSFELELTDDRIDKSEYLGLISLDATLIPKYKMNDDEDTQTIVSSVTSNLMTSNNISNSKTNKITRPGGQSWFSVLNIVLIHGTDLKAMDSNGLSDPYVKIKMENEKYRSKVN